MKSRIVAIHKDGSFVVHRAKVQQHAISNWPVSWNLEGLLVPGVYVPFSTYSCNQMSQSRSRIERTSYLTMHSRDKKVPGRFAQGAAQTAVLKCHLRSHCDIAKVHLDSSTASAAGVVLGTQAMDSYQRYPSTVFGVCRQRPCNLRRRSVAARGSSQTCSKLARLPRAVAWLSRVLGFLADCCSAFRTLQVRFPAGQASAQVFNLAFNDHTAPRYLGRLHAACCISWSGV